MKISIVFLVIFSIISVLGQDTKNLPFSPNPRLVSEDRSDTKRTNDSSITAFKKTLEVVKKRINSNVAPTEIYKVAPGDVLEIQIDNVSTNSSLKVSEEGYIEYPLIGMDPLKVEGLTIEEIEIAIAEKLKFYENPRVFVKVKEYKSHKITVLGLVEHQGIKILRREAVPLYVVLSETVPSATAKTAIILRNGERIKVSLDELETLIYPGDVIHISDEKKPEIDNSRAKSRFYYISGGVMTVGQKEFHEGMTLSQAITASGGLKKSSNKKIIIRRRNAEGLLESTEYDFKAILDGKKPDPTLNEGDIIEVENNF
jgi:polysaccharide export outer membrane protein